MSEYPVDQRKEHNEGNGEPARLDPALESLVRNLGIWILGIETRGQDTTRWGGRIKKRSESNKGISPALVDHLQQFAGECRSCADGIRRSLHKWALVLQENGQPLDPLILVSIDQAYRASPPILIQDTKQLQRKLPDLFEKFNRASQPFDGLPQTTIVKAFTHHRTSPYATTDLIDHLGKLVLIAREVANCIISLFPVRDRTFMTADNKSANADPNAPRRSSRRTTLAKRPRPAMAESLPTKRPRQAVTKTFDPRV